MYEAATFNTILKRMLDVVPAVMDKREGSVIYDALAPAAVELQLMYMELDRVLRESFADTQSRVYLIRRAAERGLIPKEASSAIRRAEFNKDIPLGSKFSLGKLNYSAFEKIDNGVFKLSCDTPGSAGNFDSGDLIPVTYIEGLTKATLSDIIIPGEDEETTEKFRQRYFDSLDSQAFGGNIADYKARVGSFQGVGGVKIVPIWNGPGTVKIIIMGSDYGVPSSELIKTVQDAVDPPDSSGTGAGLAPIGHECTVVGVTSLTMNISAALTYKDGWSWADVKPYAEKAMKEYFSSLSAAWSEADSLTVRISQIETRFLSLPGVLDVNAVTLNGKASNVILGESQIPVGGTVNVAS